MRDEAPGQREESLTIIKWLTNSENVVAEYVRELKVGPFEDEEQYYLKFYPAIETILANVTNLRSLTWNTHLPMDKGALNLLHNIHQSARLNVVFVRRDIIPIDQALLSSPLLYSLDTNVLSTREGRSTECYSEMELLKKCLIAGNSVKKMRLYLPHSKNHYCDSVHRYNNHDQEIATTWEGITLGPLGFDWKRGDEFPALEELKMNGDDFHLTDENSQMWAQTMDWSKLRKLDVWPNMPIYLIKAITGRVPNLEYFACGYMRDATQCWSLRFSEMSILSRFSASITALRELRVWADANNGDIFAVVDAVVEEQGDNLKKLCMGCRKHFSTKLEPEACLDLLQRMPKIEKFIAYMGGERVEGEWEGEGEALNSRQKYESVVRREQG